MNPGCPTGNLGGGPHPTLLSLCTVKAESSTKETVLQPCVRTLSPGCDQRQKSCFLLPPGGKCMPAARQACPGLWFWNAGEPLPRRPTVGGRCWWARPRPQTQLAHTLCVCPRNQANALRAALMGVEQLNRCPEPLCLPLGQKCQWPRGWKDGDSSRHLWLQGGRDILEMLLAQARAWILCLPRRA